MPVCSVHSAFTAGILPGGTQYITGELVFPTAPNTATVVLSPNIYSTGTYVLFDYSESTSSNPVQNLSQMILDISLLVLVQSATAVNDSSRKRVLVTLYGKSDNGVQYVDGTLDISTGVIIELDAALYASSGTYTLFTFTTFVGSVSNLTIVPPNGRYVDTSVSPNGCAIVGNTLTVTLI